MPSVIHLGAKSVDCFQTRLYYFGVGGAFAVFFDMKHYFYADGGCGWGGLLVCIPIFVGIHLLILKGLRVLQKRLQTSDFVFIEPLFRKIRFKIYALWSCLLIWMCARAIGLSPLTVLSQAFGAFLFCLLLGEVLLLVGCLGCRRVLAEVPHYAVFLHQWVQGIFGFIGVLTAANNLGYSIGSLVTALGIGGTALAFAAQKTLAELWAALSLLVDKPFKKGDRITIKGNISGEVISLGVRSTRIRTEQGSLMIIPNSMAVSECIENKGSHS